MTLLLGFYTGFTTSIVRYYAGWPQDLLYTGVLPLRLDPPARSAYAAALERLAAPGVLTGLHSCTPGPASPYLASFPGRVLALDAQVIELDVEALQGHERTGGTWILGVMDTRPGRFDAADGSRRARVFVEALSGERAVFLSGGCGSGLADEAFELRLAAALGSSL